ncbi:MULTISPECIES: FHA domain-containing protein [Methylomicrobium]|uniref:FHA domain-containing protein n=1 Tax=Methylomicrobium album BG8 TaxID=686340 RepID=H8GIT9_METAL|nr:MULTISPECIES: FHA domain-containing protein [Methylomicrobium]EIC30279.1 FHA domain-containing protein [Methylomicrobium album BG8]
MPKLTVYFKDKEIESFALDEGKVRIGRDETNEIIINSLAIAPVHAVIAFSKGVATIRALQDEFPITVNGGKTKEAILNENDMIALGKHHVLFNNASSVGGPEPFDETIENDPSVPLLFGLEPKLPNGNFQIMDGENIGKIIPIKKTMVQLGRPGQGIVVVTRKKEGYFVSTLENKGSLTVNGEPIANRIVKLSNNDILGINDKSLQFFLS